MKNEKMNLFGLLALVIVLISSCGTVDDIVTEVDPIDKITEFGPEPRIVEGEAMATLYSGDKKDSSIIEIDYAYFSRQNSQ